MKILNFGSLQIDRIYAVERFTRAGESVVAKVFDTLPGGKGLLQSIAASRAGTAVYHAGKIGSDGAFLKQALEDEGINTDFILESGNKSGHAVIQINKYDNRSVLIHSGPNMEISREETDLILGEFSAGDILLLQNEISNIPYIVHRAHQKRMIVWLNPSPVTTSLICVDLRKINYLVLNEVEGYFFTGEHRPSQMLKYLRNRYPRLKIALTLGRDGSFYEDEYQRLRQYAFITDEIDACAVGDTFVGYFLSRIVMGCKPWHALRTASIAAALAYAKEGALPSIPVREDVLYNDQKKTAHTPKRYADLYAKP